MRRSPVRMFAYALVALAVAGVALDETPRNSDATVTTLDATARNSAATARMASATTTQQVATTELPPALFVFAHEDDELLAASVAIAEHVSAGQDVHVLWLTRGEASGVRSKLNGVGTLANWPRVHNPAAEGYDPLTEETFGDARVREGTNALRVLTSGMPGSITIHASNLRDGFVTQADARAAILSVADTIAPGAPVRLKGHTWMSQLDAHPDHIATGLALKALGDEDPVRFSDRRYYLLLRYASDPDLNLVNETIDTPNTTDIRNAVILATRAYNAWSPPYTFAIGMQSVPTDFATLASNPRSIVHP